MKRESFQGVLLGIVIMCAVFAFITVAWAGLSSTLSISGTASVAAQSWKVGFGTANNSVLSSAGNVMPTVTPAGATIGPVSPGIAITSTTFGSTSTPPTLATFSTPGQKVEYTWYTVNEGTFAAKATEQHNFLSTVNATTGSNVEIECTVDDENYSGAYDDTAAQAFCDSYVKALLTINDNTYVSGDFNSSSNITIAKPNGTPTYATNKLTIEYLNTITDSNLPPAQIKIELAEAIQITYTQA